MSTDASRLPSGQAETPGQRPTFDPVPGPTLSEMEQGLRRWASQYPQNIQVEHVGQSSEGLPMLLCRITDQSVSDEDKQVVLFTATHSGIERNATTGLLHFIKWLIGNDPEAQRIRQRQIVLIMPCCEPDSFDRSTVYHPGYHLNHHVYTGWSWDGVLDPQNQPEAVAIKQVMDRYEPEVHLDVHGIWFEQATVWETTGRWWGSSLCGPYWRRIPDLLDEAAEAAGFLAPRGLESAGRLAYPEPVKGAEPWFHGPHSGPRVVASVYAYYRYHAIAFDMESGFEEAIAIRLRRLLRIGHEAWHGEPYAGYPCNQIGCWGSVAIATWGKTASQRRASRIELWRKLPQINHAMGHPELRDGVLALVTTTDRGRSKCGEDRSIEAILTNLRGDARFDGDGLDEYLNRCPPQNASFFRHPEADVQDEAGPIRNGLSIRLLLPYPNVSFSHLKLDGHDLAESDTDGYIVYHNPGTIVQVSIPPGKVEDVHVVTCLFDSDVKRTAGFRPGDWHLK